MDVVKLTPFNAVGPGKLSTLVTNELAGKSVHGLMLRVLGATPDKADVADWRVKLGGKELLPEISGDFLQSMNAHNGQADTAGYLFFFFGDPAARTARGQHLGDLDLSVYADPLEVRVKSDATAPADIDYEMSAIIGPPKMAMGHGYTQSEAMLVRALIRTEFQPAAAVSRSNERIGLGSGAGARIRGVHFFHTNMTSLEYRKAGYIKRQEHTSADNAALLAEFKKPVTAGHWPLNFVADGNQGETEATLQGNGAPWPLQMLVSTSGADTITTYADVLTAVPLI